MVSAIDGFQSHDKTAMSMHERIARQMLIRLFLFCSVHQHGGDNTDQVKVSYKQHFDVKSERLRRDRRHNARAIIWPLLKLLAKITWVLACSCSQKLCNCLSNARARKNKHSARKDHSIPLLCVVIIVGHSTNL